MALTQEDRPTVVVLRALGLGDLLTCVPALRSVRQALPGHRLVLAAPPALEPLAGLIDAVDTVLPTTELLPPLPPTEPPDVAVNLHGKGPQSHRRLLALRPEQLVAYGCPEIGFDGLPWRQEEHEVLRWCRLVETHLGATADPDQLDLAQPPTAWPGAVVVHPGAAFASRRWPADRFGAVCRALTSVGQRVVVTGSAQEKPLAAKVVRAAALPPEADLSGALDLRQLAGLVASCRLLICGDTGVAHLASAYRRPSVLLFGPVSPWRWGPPARPQHRVLWHGDGTGDPWGAERDPALDKICVDEVVEAAVDLLSRELRDGRPW